MPILLLILIAVLVAQIGFWDTLGALQGATAVMALFVLILAGAVALGAYMLFRRIRS